jgi:hypothetical protein
MTDTAVTPVSQNPFGALMRPPFVGIVTVLAMMMVIALGHSTMVLMERIFGHEHRYGAAFWFGAFGVALLWIGVRSHKEALGSWLGFFAGQILWTAWVEFGLMFFGRDLLGVPPQVADGQVVQYPEYLVMASSITVLMVTLLHFFFNRDTRCNAFVWLHEKLGMVEALGAKSSGRDRNYATITCTETIYVTWFFYVAQLLLYDTEVLPGAPYHPLVYAAFFGCLIWGLYLGSRLIKFQRMSTALRYAIPTATILWCDVEFLSRWNMLTELWLEPWKYTVQMSLILVGCVIAIYLIWKSPKKLSELEAGL